MVRIKPLIVFSIRLFFLLFIMAGIGVLVVWITIVPSLPPVDSLKDLRLQVPLRIYSADHKLMAEIGEQRRRPLELDEMPEPLKLAFLSAEDDRFYQHPGVDWRGTTRAVWLYTLSMGRGRVPGGSTITQQVARRFFLSTDYSVTRKLREMLLAFKIERELDKDEILELYLNKEFLGHRAYGVAAAAQVYYGKTPAELSLAQMAMIAGLPKAPSRDNPISGPERAMIRRNWILGRMLELGHIEQSEYTLAMAEPNTARFHGPEIELESPWVAEMVRQDAVDRLGAEAAYNEGFVAYTTIQSELQQAANRAIRDGLNAYDRRHGWRGPEDQIEADLLDDVEAINEHLDSLRGVAGLVPAVVLAAGEEDARLRLQGGTEIELELASIQWARPFINSNSTGPAPQAFADVLSAGDIVRVRHSEDGWQLAQIPLAEAALISLDASTGEILALTGGLDFNHSQFNRVTQSLRQPGSAFKPFIYAAALEHGFTPASQVNDAPVVVDDPSQERAWKPTNFGQRFFGPTRLREAMVDSRNLVSVRLLMAMGMDSGRDYMSRFGFAAQQMPTGASMALGSASLTPLSVASGYAVFANGGYAIEPRYLYAVAASTGHFVHEPQPLVLCRDCPEIPPPNALEVEEPEAETTPRLVRPQLAAAQDVEAATGPLEGADEPVGPPRPHFSEQVLDPAVAWLIDSMMSDVISRGTGRRAQALGRSDLAGKTGTTNGFRDTWFAGYGGGLVTVVWLGMDDYQTLGSQEQGGRTALPLWVDFMGSALEGRPETDRPLPVGLTRALIDPDTGHRVRPGTPGAMTEWFLAEHLPPLDSSSSEAGSADPYDIF